MERSMTDAFSRAVEAIFRRTDPGPTRTPKVAPPGAIPKAQNAAEHRRKWFAHFAEERVLPLLVQVADSAEKHGASATTKLAEVNEQLAAELVIVPRSLPTGAKPPRLTVYAVDGERPLMVEYTGTFPHVGATGGFGAEIDYDPIFTSQLEEKILDFVALAAGV
jgi:hypothetical protein